VAVGVVVLAAASRFPLHLANRAAWIFHLHRRLGMESFSRIATNDVVGPLLFRAHLHRSYDTNISSCRPPVVGFNQRSN
jgi:hypothetical protein